MAVIAAEVEDRPSCSCSFRRVISVPSALLQAATENSRSTVREAGRKEGGERPTRPDLDSDSSLLPAGRCLPSPWQWSAGTLPGSHS